MDDASTTTLRFAEAARTLGRSARHHGLTVPTFRSPPRIEDVRRSIRWGGDESTISVVLRDRPWSAVLSDMIEGVLVANRLDRGRADIVRASLWTAVEDQAMAA